MLQPRATGRSASARKYDLLTAMGSYALAQAKGPQRLVLRLMTLITARYNWGRDELCVGQREIAQLWSVDERTVKREMAKLRAMGWLVVRRQGARGRVTQYSIDIEAILKTTQPQWAAVGPDFVLRMEQGDAPDPKVVPLPMSGSVAPPDLSDGSEWALAQAVLHQEDPALFGAWARSLVRQDRAGGRLTLCAPSRFHAAYVETHLKDRILALCHSVDSEVSEIRITHA
ncbi:hypothetical protein [Cochlodiniinecator piscidefendens]|uniref:hypothetical protein n=1 Tax=Cochlodiniinecator piscidefendens TaxID=2715756 RepID=UPI00140D4D68|nr:hypothetical protein [Cochlodiniinecator piscidefendens]